MVLQNKLNNELYESFQPMLTPKEMIRMGVFGGTYFSKLVDYRTFPKEWFSDIDERFYLSNNYQKEVNYFKIKSGQSQEEWELKGWIHKDDPRGWFEWYCKFFNGRRHEDDVRQIKRWLAFCGPKGRFRNNIYKKIFRAGVRIQESYKISPRIQQSLLHWSYKVNNGDYEKWKLDNDKRL